MKLKVFGFGLTLILSCLTHNSFAQNYYPPERLTCMLDRHNKIKCYTFNRKLLKEETTNAELQRRKNSVFHFVSAVAYTTPTRNETSVFYTYNDSMYKLLRLKTVHTRIQPDYTNPNWKKFNDDIYTCDAGYMNCPIKD